MNKKVITILFTIITFSISNIYGQKIKEKEIIEVVDVKLKSKTELYDNAKQWILSRFMTSDNIVEFDNDSNNTINITGHILMEKQKFLQGLAGHFVKTSSNTLTFKLRIDLKDGKFRYSLSNMTYSFYQIGGPNQGYVQNPLYNITDMPKKKIREVEIEAEQKILVLIAEMKQKITNNQANNKDW